MQGAVFQRTLTEADKCCTNERVLISQINELSTQHNAAEHLCLLVDQESHQLFGLLSYHLQCSEDSDGIAACRSRHSIHATFHRLRNETELVRRPSPDPITSMSTTRRALYSVTACWLYAEMPCSTTIAVATASLHRRTNAISICTVVAAVI